MTVDQALSLLDQVVAQVSTSRENHEKIKAALNVLYVATHADSEKKPLQAVEKKT